MAPNVFGQALRINPLLVIFALLLGGEIAGFIGAFLALPIAAIVRETVVYMRRHLASSAGTCRPSRRRRAQQHCPECGALVPRGAAGVPALRHRARRPRRRSAVGRPAASGAGLRL